MGACPACGTSNTPDARFCNGCGAELGAGAPPRAERRVVTILFADLTGFTARAEPLDPEDVRAFLVPYYDVLTAEITTYGGRVDRFLGDGIMAVFGAPRAHEDDPERAVRAGLRIVARVPGLGLDLHVRVGVNTGEVLYTPSAADARDDAVTGDAVNTAARLQAAASADAVVVGESTWRATAHVIRYAELPPIVAKGKRDPVPLWHALEPIARAGGEPMEERTPFVGRDLELHTLIAAFERSRSTPTLETVTIVAEPGIGKSRLVRELARHVDALPDLVTWRVGRCLPYGEGIGFWALGEIVRAHAGILDTDDRDARDAKLDAVIVDPDPALRRWMKDRVAPLAGLPSATEPPTADEAFAAWRRFFVSVATAGPTVLVVEDLHWADTALVSFLGSLADEAAGLPLLVVATARPEVAERYPGWLARPRRATVLSLAGLPDEQMRALVGAVLGRTSDELQDTVLARAAGSPLFAEQIAAMLRDRAPVSGTPPPDDAGAPAGGSSLRDLDAVVPPSLQAMLAARIDDLPAAPRTVLLAASVVGKRFWPGAVAAIGGFPQAELRPALEELVRRELVRPVHPSSMSGEDELAFWHALVRDVAYAALTRPDRLARHRAVAGWVAALPGASEGAASEIVAAHLERALELADALGDAGTAATVRSELVGAHVASADHAMRTEVPRAVGHLRRALELLPAADPLRPAVLERLGRMYNSLGDVPAAVASLEAAAAAYAAAGDLAGAAGLAPFLAVALAFAGEGDRAQVILADAREALGERPGADLVAVVAEQAMFAMLADRLDDAVALADEALTLAADLGLPPPHRALHARGWVRYQSDPEAGEADFRASIDRAVDAGRILSAAGAMTNLALSRGNVFGPDAALAALEEAAAFREAHGLPLVPLGFSRLDQLEIAGRWDEALAEAGPLRSWAESHGDAWGTWSVDLVVAAIRLARGELAGEGEDLLRRGSAVGMPQYAAPVAARIAFLGGDVAAARRILAESVADRPPGSIDRPAALVRACVECGAPDLARRASEIGSTAAPWKAAETIAAEAMLADADGDPARAIDGYRRAASRLAALGVRAEAAYALEGLGRCELRVGDVDAGRASLREARALWEEIGAPPRTAAIDALLPRT